MSNQPAPENQPELFDLAATLAGVSTVDLLKVRQDGDALIVILCTGQKFRFDAGDIAGQIGDAIRGQFAEDPAPAPAPAAKASRKR